MTNLKECEAIVKHINNITIDQFYLQRGNGMLNLRKEGTNNLIFCDSIRNMKNLLHAFQGGLYEDTKK